MSQLPEEKVNEIIKLYQEKIPLEEIRNRLNVGTTTIYRYLDKANIKRHKNFTDEDMNKAVNLYLTTNKTLLEVATEMGSSSQKISKYMKAHNIPLKRSSKLNFNENVFSNINTEEQAYFLGLMYSDGNVRSDKDSIRIGMIDKDIIEKFNIFLNGEKQRIKEIVSEKEEHHTIYEVNYGSKKLKEDLIKLGCMPNKTFKLTCPTQEQVPQHLFKHFIRGYVDGDGSIQYDHTPKITLLGTEDFLLGVQKRMNWEDKFLEKRNNIFALYYYGKDKAFKYITELYENSSIYLERKYNQYIKIKNIICEKEGIS